MPEDISKPIVEVLLKENENIGLVFPVTQLKEYDIYFFRVMRRFPLHRVYNTTLPELAAGGTQTLAYLGDTGMGTGNDTLEIWEQLPLRLLHFAFGIAPDDIALYRASPAGYLQTGFAYQTPTIVGDDFDFVTGDLSPYDMPTVTTETIMHYKASLEIGLENRSDVVVRPSIRILGAGYDTIQITCEDFIKKIIAGIKPCRFITVGGLQMFSPSIPSEWSDDGKMRVNSKKMTDIMRGA
ncbi:MAG: hypothetical protein PHU95_03535 [Candidatus Thermoplasmatota archaeon]|nr:hypothetical protein [Candidatus Thermoplasmatota archaeon]MDD5778500.1 hypothetical protein [Candidatus Thermoplasmatota archaeon]